VVWCGDGGCVVVVENVAVIVVLFLPLSSQPVAFRCLKYEINKKCKKSFNFIDFPLSFTKQAHGTSLLFCLHF